MLLYAYFPSVYHLGRASLVAQTVKNLPAMQETLGEAEAVTDFTFLGSKITVDSDCSHEIF